MSDLYEVAMLVKQAAEAEYEDAFSKVAKRNGWNNRGQAARVTRVPSAPAPAPAPFAPVSYGIDSSYAGTQAVPNDLYDDVVRVSEAKPSLLQNAKAKVTNAAASVANKVKGKKPVMTELDAAYDAVYPNGVLGPINSRYQAGKRFVGRNPKAIAGALGAAALIGAGGYLAGRKETQAAKTAAELMYSDAMQEADELNEKIAFAQQLFEEADYAEKTAGYNEEFIEDSAFGAFLSKMAYQVVPDALYDEVVRKQPASVSTMAKAKAKANSVVKSVSDYFTGNNVAKSELDAAYDAAYPQYAGARGAVNSKYQAGKRFVGRNPKAIAGALGAAALIGAGGYLAGRHETQAAKTAAELMYSDAMQEADELNEKIAFAQQLFDEADYVEKIAEDNGGGTQVPYLAAAGYGAGVGAAVGGGLATLQAVMQKQPVDPRLVGKATAAGAAMGAAAAPLAQAGIAGVGALKAFVDEHRAQRAAQNLQG